MYINKHRGVKEISAGEANITASRKPLGSLAYDSLNPCKHFVRTRWHVINLAGPQVTGASVLHMGLPA